MKVLSCTYDSVIDITVCGSPMSSTEDSDPPHLAQKKVMIPTCGSTKPS